MCALYLLEKSSINFSEVSGKFVSFPINAVN